MKKRDLKKRISEAYKAETPDLRSKILISCEKEQQMPVASPIKQSTYASEKRLNFNIVFKRVAAVAVCIMLFLSGLSLGLFMPEKEELTVSESAVTFVYLDVNPSIELQIDTNSRIVECIAGNDDAKGVLADLDLKGVDMNTALTAIVGSMYVNGYLTEDSNSILVSVDSKDEGDHDTLLSDLTEKINAVFEKSAMTCSIIAQSVEVNDELKQRAQENGVSVGKMHLVDKMVGGLDDYDEDDAPELADMSIRELNLIYSTIPEKSEGKDSFDDDVYHGEVGGFVTQKDALTLLLKEIGVDIADVENYRVNAKMNFGESRQMVYIVSIRLKENTTVYEFEVDCKNGEVVKIDENMPGINIPESDEDIDDIPDDHGDKDEDFPDKLH